MKKFTVTDAEEAVETGDNIDPRLYRFEIIGPESMQASDGYHSFDELYDHRFTLFIALCRALAKAGPGHQFVWRSKLHADGTMYEGAFIMGIGKQRGKQITYHLPLARWEEIDFAETLNRAPEWDRHTPQDVISRLKALE
jgi:hypothetical protein